MTAFTSANGEEIGTPPSPAGEPGDLRVGPHRRGFGGRLGRHRRRQLPPLSVFPTLCTLGNLIAGFAAIHFAAKPLEFTGIWEWSGLHMAAVLIFIGMIFDAVDGSIARLTRSTSELGAQLDSLADVVTFGIAPAFMTTMLVGHYLASAGQVVDYTLMGPVADHWFGRIVWALAAGYICCAALRLARFNVETPTAAAEDHSFFRGLPSPGAAGAIAGLILLHQHLHARFDDDVPLAFMRGTALVVPFIMTLCAVVMVSSLKYPHVINRYFRGRRSFRYIAWLLVPVILMIWFPQLILALAFCAYALSAPAERVWTSMRRSKADPTAPATS